jgi:MoxR-like ATPase
MTNAPVRAVAEEAAGLIATVQDDVTSILRGKPAHVQLALITLLADGHLLLDDVPGVGKTLLAKALARALGVETRRVQFTPDLLPADVVGGSVWIQNEGAFRFHPGPVFTNVLLCDEINRAPEKTQASLLEAMEERQVTVDGRAKALPSPFFVIATQNPYEHLGVYELPESQLDRFLVRMTIGYPSREATIAILDDDGSERRVGDLRPVLNPTELVRLQQVVREVHVAGALKGYLADVVEATRTAPDVRLGASPRAAISLLRASRATALVSGRSFVTPDDVQSMAVPVLAHRVHMHDDARVDSVEAIHRALARVPVPVARR